MSGARFDAWLQTIEPGDTVLFGKGKIPRLVRHVHRYRKDGRLKVTLWFAIRRCSWTGKGYTLYDARETQAMIRPSRYPRVRVDKLPGHRKFLATMTWVRKPETPEPPLDCCAVRGWA
jgi:hypothetical protein